MAASEIFEFFLSEKQNCGMLFECPSPLQETAMAERSRKSRLTAGLCARQSGADELSRRLANAPPMNEGGNFPPLKALKTQKTRKESRRGGRLAPLHSPLRSRACPEMAPQGLEKIESAPGNGMVSEASNPQDVVHGRAADHARLRLTSRKNDKAAIQEGKFSASQPLEIAQNRERISKTSLPRISPPRSYGEGSGWGSPWFNRDDGRGDAMTWSASRGGRPPHPWPLPARGWEGNSPPHRLPR